MGWEAENEKRGRDATQPRVTVRPKPPVLLGATSAMGRWHRAGIVSDNPSPGRSRRLQGSHRDAPRTISGRVLLPTPVTLPSRGSLPFLDPALQRSLGFPPFHLAASLRASLAPTLRCSLEVRRAVVSELTTDSPPVSRGQWRFAKSRRSPHLSAGHPQATSFPSPVLPHAEVDHRRRAPLTSQLFPPRCISLPPGSATPQKASGPVERAICSVECQTCS
jgi:hypothetical protein